MGRNRNSKNRSNSSLRSPRSVFFDLQWTVMVAPFISFVMRTVVFFRRKPAWHPLTRKRTRNSERRRWLFIGFISGRRNGLLNMENLVYHSFISRDVCNNWNIYCIWQLGLEVNGNYDDLCPKNDFTWRFAGKCSSNLCFNGWIWCMYNNGWLKSWYICV